MTFKERPNHALYIQTFLPPYLIFLKIISLKDLTLVSKKVFLNNEFNSIADIQKQLKRTLVKIR